VEPFAGGASVALQLLCDGLVDQIGLADIDPLITSFWKCVFFDTDWLVNAIEQVVVSLTKWEELKKLETDDIRQRALKCIFLNRTSFSGILSPAAGAIGGKKQTSEYKIDCRFTKATVIKRIRQASSLRDKVAFVWQCDWSDCLDDIQNIVRLDNSVFIYLDPPFYAKAEKLYTHYFRDSDHKALHDSLIKLAYPWLLSYDPAETIESLYTSNGAKPRRVEMLYSTAGSSGVIAAQELIITNLPILPQSYRLWQKHE
jgi:DNA adenine methylase